MRSSTFLAAVLSICTTTAMTTTLSLAQTVVDPNLRVNAYTRGFDEPTGVAFLDADGTALVTEKDGRVKLIRNRVVKDTLLNLPVNTDSERGLLSVTLSPSFATDGFVYLYHTAALTPGGRAISNKISRYRWDGTNDSLTFDRKIIDLPVSPGPNHDGGKIAFSPNGKLFTVIGDLNRQERTQNFESSTALTRTGAILRLQPNGRAVPGNPFPGPFSFPTESDDIWAYGIRNSFGLAVDPVTGDLWDTENGPDRMDEINRVTPGFNSGWKDIMGPRSRSGGSTGTLESLGSRANYQDPKMSWDDPVAPTDLEFFNSSKFGSAYRNDLFVGDVKTGTIYRFDLTSNRKSLALSGDLADGVADNTGSSLLEESDQLIFGSGFGTTSDIITGPGGLFVLSISNGALYRITTNSPSVQFDARAMQVPEPSMLTALGFFAMISFRRGTKSRVLNH